VKQSRICIRVQKKLPKQFSQQVETYNVCKQSHLLSGDKAAFDTNEVKTFAAAQNKCNKLDVTLQSYDDLFQNSDYFDFNSIKKLSLCKNKNNSILIVHLNVRI